MIHRAFFGDVEHDFTLPLAMIEELERKTGGRIGSQCTRLFTRQFSHLDVSETIRGALIGGGMSLERAAEIIDSYVTGRPLMEVYPLAVANCANDLADRDVLNDSSASAAVGMNTGDAFGRPRVRVPNSCSQ